MTELTVEQGSAGRGWPAAAAGAEAERAVAPRDDLPDVGADAVPQTPAAEQQVRQVG